MSSNEFNMLTGENTIPLRQLASFETSVSHIAQSLDYGTSTFCSCGALTKIMSATNLLRGRIITAVNNELDQYQQSMDLLLPSSKQVCISVLNNGMYSPKNTNVKRNTVRKLSWISIKLRERLNGYQLALITEELCGGCQCEFKKNYLYIIFFNILIYRHYCFVSIEQLLLVVDCFIEYYIACFLCKFLHLLPANGIIFYYLNIIAYVIMGIFLFSIIVNGGIEDSTRTNLVEKYCSIHEKVVSQFAAAFYFDTQMMDISNIVESYANLLQKEGENEGIMEIWCTLDYRYAAIYSFACYLYAGSGFAMAGF
uniref:ABC transmembrane type-1 domain-containing protein n=1 Tax=Heterorhabditis bacteriophora TaxID=37862 RepID=A0A1I7WCF0_HETBA